MVFQKCIGLSRLHKSEKGIYETTEFLERFLRNLLPQEFHNREMHVSGLLKVLLESDPINDPIKPDEREQRILDLMRSDPGITRIRMAEQIGCSESTVKRTIQTMIAKKNDPPYRFE